MVHVDEVAAELAEREVDVLEIRHALKLPSPAPLRRRVEAPVGQAAADDVRIGRLETGSVLPLQVRDEETDAVLEGIGLGKRLAVRQVGQLGPPLPVLSVIGVV